MHGSGENIWLVIYQNSSRCPFISIFCSHLKGWNLMRGSTALWIRYTWMVSHSKKGNLKNCTSNRKWLLSVCISGVNVKKVVQLVSWVFGQECAFGIFCRLSCLMKNISYKIDKCNLQSAWYLQVPIFGSNIGWKVLRGYCYAFILFWVCVNTRPSFVQSADPCRGTPHPTTVQIIGATWRVSARQMDIRPEIVLWHLLLQRDDLICFIF